MSRYPRFNAFLFTLGLVGGMIVAEFVARFIEFLAS